MKFFTPDLYRRFNSADDAEADMADAEWEEKLREYRDFIAKHVSDMNERVRELAEQLSLHDAELLSIQEDLPRSELALPFAPLSVATVSVSVGKTITNVIYFLWSPMEQSEPAQDWPFQKQRAHWLYDEIDVQRRPACPPLFWHRILWSDGRVVSIPFFDVVVQSYSPQEPQTEIIARKRA